MNSRLSLSILAALNGGILMFLLISVGIMPVIKGQHNIVSVSTIVVGIICMAIGWMRIFRRRPTIQRQ